MKKDFSNSKKLIRVSFLDKIMLSKNFPYEEKSTSLPCSGGVAVADKAIEVPAVEWEPTSPFREHQKQQIMDVEVIADITADTQNIELFFQKKLERVFAVGRCFTGITFKQSIIKDCYFRNCEFLDCNFTGAHISNSNFQGVKFEGCDFSYTTFEKTDIGLDILTHNLPPHENLKRDLARTLRTNYGSTGNYEGVNFAILIELAATLEHYRKAAFSAESHYRRKYKGINRLKHAGKYIGFWILDKLWGNGERPRRLVLVAAFVWLIGAIFGFFVKNLPFIDASVASANCFILGSTEQLGSTAAIPLVLARYLILGMFMASLVKRLARR